MLTFGILALVFVNQQRDRRRLGLDAAVVPAPAAPAPIDSAPAVGAEPASLGAVTKA